MTAALAPLQILAAWFSPGYPVGAYSYSHGLEWAVEAGDVRDPARRSPRWVADVVAHGAGRSDAILLAHAMASDDAGPLAELAEALAPSAERHLETMAQGAAFARTTAAAYGIAVPARSLSRRGGAGGPAPRAAAGGDGDALPPGLRRQPRLGRRPPRADRPDRRPAHPRRPPAPRGRRRRGGDRGAADGGRRHSPSAGTSRRCATRPSTRASTAPERGRAASSA